MNDLFKLFKSLIYFRGQLMIYLLVLGLAIIFRPFFEYFKLIFTYEDHYTFSILRHLHPNRFRHLNFSLFCLIGFMPQCLTISVWTLAFYTYLFPLKWNNPDWRTFSPYLNLIFCQFLFFVQSFPIWSVMKFEVIFGRLRHPLSVD